MKFMGISDRTSWICVAAAVILVAAGLIFTTGRGIQDMDIIIGTYGEQLYICSYNHRSMEFSVRDSVKAKNPSYVLGEGDMIYAVSECGPSSGAYSFMEKSDGTYEKTAGLQQTGADPCFVMIHEQNGGRFMLTADYSGGSISVFPVKDGKIEDRCHQLVFSGNGPVKARQEASHIHQLKVLPKTGVTHGSHILASDLGADVIRLLHAEIPTDGPGTPQLRLTHIKDISCPAGSGPRHMEFSHDGRILYCIAELSGEVLVYDIAEDEDGSPAFNLKQRIQADEVNAGGSADIHIHPSGKWLYTSHRLDNDGIAIFSIQKDGTLEKTGYQRTARHPRNFMITPDGDFLLAACRDDRLVQVFRTNEDGSLTLTPKVLRLEGDMPSSITLLK